MWNVMSRQYPGKKLEAMSLALNYHRWIVDEFESYVRRNDCGRRSGVGSVPKLLSRTRIKCPIAFDPSANMYPHLEQELRHEQPARAVNDFVSPRYAREGFNSVVYINVLEHMEDDRTEPASALEILTPEGHLLLFVPPLPWLHGDVDERIGHFRRYEKTALSTPVRDVGFVLVRARYFDPAGIIPWYVNHVLLRNSMGSASVSFSDKLVLLP